MKKTLFLAGLFSILSSSVFGAAVSDPTAAKSLIEQDLPSYRDIVKGNIYVDAASRYTRHGLTPNNLICGEGSVAVGFDMTVKTGTVIDVIGKFSQTSFPGKTKYDLVFNNQTDSFIGIKAENLWPGMYTSAGYSLIEGGLAGLASQFREYQVNVPKLMTTGQLGGIPGRDRDQLLTYVLMQRLLLADNHGAFVVGSVSGSIDSTEGWLTNFGCGHSWKLGEHVKLVSKLMVYYSYQFWGDRAGKDYNGTDGYALNIDLPVNISKEMVLSPYIGMTWAGHNPRAIDQKKIGGKQFFDSAFKKYAIIWGGKISWEF